MTKSTPLNANSDQSRDIKVLQFGGGNFMRAYLDWMVQRLNDDFEFAGGVALVKPTGGPQYQDLEEQGGRYHVVTSGIKDKEVIQKIDLITCIDQIYYPYDDFTAFIELAKQESILIITSNTTESGIVFAPGDTPDQTPPDSFPGKLCVFLRARYEFFAGALDRGFFILPCELIADNGKTLETIVLKLAQTWYEDSAFNHWIKQANTFVNTLVDRIVPGFPKPQHYQSIAAGLSFADRCVVVAEPYHLLVLEDVDELEHVFPLKAAGINVIYTDSLSKYRTLKVRLLNGAHIAMVPVGLLMGITTVRGFVEHKQTLGFVNQLLEKEIAHTLTGIPGEETTAYIADVLDRFRNPFIEHELFSIALNAVSKFKVRLLPGLKASLTKGGNTPHCMILAFACLLRFYRGDWEGHQLPVQDAPEILEKFHQAWKANFGDAHALTVDVLSDVTLWDEDLTDLPNLVPLVASKLEVIQKGRLGLEMIKIVQELDEAEGRPII